MLNITEQQVHKQSEYIEKRTALFVATFAAFLTPFMGSALNVALPSIGKDFNADAILINWIASSYILATAIFLLPFGRIGDIIGRKKIFTYGIICFTISSLGCGISVNTGFLIVFRVLQGTGKLSDKIQPGILASAGMTASALGLFMLTFIDKNSHFFARAEFLLRWHVDRLKKIDCESITNKFPYEKQIILYWKFENFVRAY